MAANKVFQRPLNTGVSAYNRGSTVRYGLCLAAACLLTCPSISFGEPGALKHQPYLDCGATRLRYGYLLKSKGYDNTDELKEIEEQAWFYIQAAEAVAGRPLKKELLEASSKAERSSDELINGKGIDAYLKYESDKRRSCADMMKRNQDDLMKLMVKEPGQ